MRSRLWPLGLFALLLVACSSDSSDGFRPAQACTPGKIEACPCPGTPITGIQTCQPNGTFGECSGCPAGSQGGAAGSGASGGSGGSGPGGAGGSKGGSGGAPAGAGGNATGGAPAGGGGAPSGPDADHDGYTVEQGDCNDQDPNINPGAADLVEVGPDGKPVLLQVDNDCSGKATLPAEAGACDDNLGPKVTDPFDAARAMGLCSVKVPDGPTGPWGVIAATFSDIAGGPLNGAIKATGQNLDLSFGILPDFGKHTVPREGKRLFALSSGEARAVGHEGYDAGKVCSFDKGYSSGFPSGFPKEGSCGKGGEPKDGVALDLKIRVPSNARSLRFKYRFFSCEYPDYTCNVYNDVFAVMLSPSPLVSGDPMTDANNLNADIAFEAASGKKNVIGVNNESFLTACEPGATQGNYVNCKPGNGDQLVGSGFEKHAASSWLVSQANVPPGGIIYLRIAIWDSSDGILDSTAVLDAFEWSPDSVDGAVNVTEGTTIPTGTGGAPQGGAGGAGQAGNTSGIFGGSNTGTGASAGTGSGGAGASAGSGGAGSGAGGMGTTGPCPDGSCSAQGQCCKDPGPPAVCGQDFSGLFCL